MKYTVKFNPEFLNDLTEAVDWYNKKQSGLGDRLSGIVKKQTSALSGSALHFAIKYDDVRCMSIEKFPYLVHYRVDESQKTVKVEALFHMSRNPDIWDERKHD